MATSTTLHPASFLEYEHGVPVKHGGTGRCVPVRVGGAELLAPRLEHNSGRGGLEPERHLDVDERERVVHEVQVVGQSGGYEAQKVHSRGPVGLDHRGLQMDGTAGPQQRRRYQTVQALADELTVLIVALFSHAGQQRDGENDDAAVLDHRSVAGRALRRRIGMAAEVVVGPFEIGINEFHQSRCRRRPVEHEAFAVHPEVCRHGRGKPLGRRQSQERRGVRSFSDDAPTEGVQEFSALDAGRSSGGREDERPTLVHVRPRAVRPGPRR